MTFGSCWLGEFKQLCFCWIHFWILVCLSSRHCIEYDYELLTSSALPCSVLSLFAVLLHRLHCPLSSFWLFCLHLVSICLVFFTAPSLRCWVFVLFLFVFLSLLVLSWKCLACLGLSHHGLAPSSLAPSNFRLVMSCLYCPGNRCAFPTNEESRTNWFYRETFTKNS